MSKDTIYREDAIKTVISKPAWHGSDGSYYHGDDIRDALKGLPSADRPQGEWIDNGDRYFRCSLCGAKDTDKWLWCHGCGVKMKGVSDAV